MPSHGCYGHVRAKTYRAIAHFIFKCFRLDGPNYISQFFTPRLTNYNLRGRGSNVVQPPYNSLVMHNSFLNIIALDHHLDTISRSSKWYEVCRVPVYGLYIILSLFLYLYTDIFLYF